MLRGQQSGYPRGRDPADFAGHLERSVTHALRERRKILHRTHVGYP